MYIYIFLVHICGTYAARMRHVCSLMLAYAYTVAYAAAYERAYSGYGSVCGLMRAFVGRVVLACLRMNVQID
jgi:hypothetical protein